MSCPQWNDWLARSKTPAKLGHVLSSGLLERLVLFKFGISHHITPFKSFSNSARALRSDYAAYIKAVMKQNGIKKTEAYLVVSQEIQGPLYNAISDLFGGKTWCPSLLD